MSQLNLRPIFQTSTVVAFSVTGAALVGLWLVVRYPNVRSSVFDPSGTFLYFVPLMVPMIAFMFERVERVREANFFQHGIDCLVFGLSVGRVAGNVPYISGHALLLSYAIVCTRSNFVRVTSILVLAQTLFLKYYVWGDFVTSNVGLALGVVLAGLVLLQKEVSAE